MALSAMAFWLLTKVLFTTVMVNPPLSAAAAFAEPGLAVAPAVNNETARAALRSGAAVITCEW